MTSLNREIRSDFDALFSVEASDSKFPEDRMREWMTDPQVLDGPVHELRPSEEKFWRDLLRVGFSIAQIRSILL